VEAFEMPMIGFCSGCNRFVQLSLHGECPHGHPRSRLRNVRDGLLSDMPVAKTPVHPRSAEQAALAAHDSIYAKVAGKAIIILPVAVVLAWGIWSGMEQFSGSNISFVAKLGWALLSLAMTIGGAFLLAGRRRHR
jgi:hypothetical protein